MSWSAFDLFRKNPEEFRQRYFYGKEGFQNEKMAFGKAFAKAMELGEETGDSDIDLPAQFMPKYPHREYEMRAKLMDPKTGEEIVILGKFDGYSPAQFKPIKAKKYNRRQRFDSDPATIVPVIGEYKTGTRQWTQARVDVNDQLTWYALVHFRATGASPLLRLHAYHNESKMIKTFETYRTPVQVMNMAGQAIRVWRGIVRMAQEEYSKIA